MGDGAKEGRRYEINAEVQTCSTKSDDYTYDRSGVVVLRPGDSGNVAMLSIGPLTREIQQEP